MGRTPSSICRTLIRYPRLGAGRGAVTSVYGLAPRMAVPTTGHPTMGTGFPRYDEVRCRFAGLDPVSTVGRAARAAT